ncbi:hypothetical protein TNCV_4607341 [Trichonephila clavipes]|nr:hypothetical protein TNCV_4607341 [Trichonephila clavipes]
MIIVICFRLRKKNSRCDDYMNSGTSMSKSEFYDLFGNSDLDTSECTRSTCSLNQWVHSLVGLITSAGTGEYFPPLQFTCRNCGGGDRGRVAIYRPFGEFRRAKIALSPVWC